MSKSRRTLTDDRTRIVNSFGQHVIDLVELVANIIPDNEELGVIKKLVHRAVYSAGNVVIEEVGPELWPYRDNISNNDFGFITQVDYNAKLDSKKHMLEESTESTYKSLIKVCLGQYGKCSSTEKDQIHQFVKNIFTDYVRYTIHCRKYTID